MQQGSNAAQGFANQGAIQAQAATAPFQSLLGLGQVAASFYNPSPRRQGG